MTEVEAEIEKCRQQVKANKELSATLAEHETKARDYQSQEQVWC